MRVVRTIVLRAAGTNCDYETVHAFRLAGSQVELTHINELVRGRKRLSDYHILAIPGGFTYGDDIAAGKILANELRYKLMNQLREFVEEGKLILGICNGFQVLVKAGLLPALDGGGQKVTLTINGSGRFEDRWVYLKRVDGGRCVFTRGIEGMIYLPVAHAEGKFIPRDEEVMGQLLENGQVVFQYVGPDGNPADYPWNPNGSFMGVAGICDLTGRILGLMPHPERFVHPTQHPCWTRERLGREGDGLAIFRNAMEYAWRKL